MARIGRDLKDHQVPVLSAQAGMLTTESSTRTSCPGPIQLSLKHLQTWGAYNFSAQPTYVVDWLRSKMFSFTQTTRRAVLTGDIRIWVTGTDMTSYCPRIFACCLTKAYSTLNSLLSARLKVVFLTSQQTAGQSRWVHSTLPINNQSILDSLTLQLLPTACFCYHEEGRAPQPIS